MLTIARLFGKSPFAPLQTHMEKVSLCITKLTHILEGLHSLDPHVLETEVKELSKLEHEADLTKNDIRNHLPKSLFLPIDRDALLDILSIQDHLADKAEDIGHLLILHPFNPSDPVFGGLIKLFKKNTEAFWDTLKIIHEMHDLLESSFGGMEAERVKAMVEATSYKEHEADKMKYALLGEVFKAAPSLSMPTFYLYIRLIEEVNAISHTSERLANRIRTILDIK
jgi:predicted phosphate transport protein (TIGR00153 family)